MRTKALAIMFFLTVPVGLAVAQQSSDRGDTKSNESACPMMHDSHAHGPGASPSVDERGEKGMGFSQTATTHHFLVTSEGGVIKVEVNHPADTTNRDNIRQHLAHIARAFKAGDFDIPMFVHDTAPPGMAEMQQRREKIKYSFEETPGGGRVVIATADREAIVAIHKFLLFQIEEHKTGDPTQLR